MTGPSPTTTRRSSSIRIRLAYNNRGLYIAPERTTTAPSPTTRAIKLNPKFALAYNNRGSLHSNRKDYDRAIADYSEAIRLDPKFALRLQQPRHVTTSKKDYDRAIADYGEAIKLDPKPRAATTTAASRLQQARLRPRHRRLQRGDQARSEIRCLIQQSRRRVPREREPRPRHRRLQRSDQARPELVTTSARTATQRNKPGARAWLRSSPRRAFRIAGCSTSRRSLLDVIHDSKTVYGGAALNNAASPPGLPDNTRSQLRWWHAAIRFLDRWNRHSIRSSVQKISARRNGRVRRCAIESPGDWTRIAAFARRIAATRRNRIRPSSRAQGVPARREASARGDRQSWRDAQARKIFPGPARNRAFSRRQRGSPSCGCSLPLKHFGGARDQGLLPIRGQLGGAMSQNVSIENTPQARDDSPISGTKTRCSPRASSMRRTTSCT